MNKLQSASGAPVPHNDKSKDWQLEILMEKLRSKASQFKSLPEISKNVRMTLLEKRYASDSVEKSQHQKCLDTLQHSIKVTSLQSMVERLESLTRQLGLKFVVEPSGVFISSDMFYLEIVLSPAGIVEDVKIHHEGKKEQQSCTELVNCLSKGDFADFTVQLEGFTSIYQLNAEKKIKCKAFTALESLEADLITLAQLQMFMKEPFNLIHKSPVGILEKRKGGHPMKLTYFVSPYDLLNVEKNEIEPINVDTITGKGLGYSVTVCMEGSAAHKLQTATLITVNRGINGKSTPSYTPLNNQNSAVIPACFLLKLNKPLPLCLSLVRQIQQIYPWTEIDSAPVQPLLNLIVTHCSDEKMNSSNNKGLFVTLPDQNHCYFMTENKNMDGVLVTSIPFTHPAHVASILMILREQALFNTIIASCVRPNSKQDFENMTIFEVSALSSTHISISLEHPVEESMATAEIDLSDISNLICRIHSPGTPPPVNTSDVATELSTKILNKSFSIPVTLRSVIKLWEKQSMRRNHYGGHENFNLPLGSGDPGGAKDPANTNLVEFGGLNDKIKQEPSGNSNHNMMMQASQEIFLNQSMMASNFQDFPPSDGVLTTLELTNILSENMDKSSKRQKRRHEDSSKSGKRKVGTEDSDLIESSSCDSTSRSTPLSQETEIRTPNSLLGFQTDLELSVSGIDPIELLGSNDKTEEEFDNLEDMEIDEISSKDFKKELKDKSPSRSESEEKLTGLSITPISSNSSSNSKDRRTSETPPLPNSLTITPIPNQHRSLEEKSREKKSKSSKDEKSKLDKKRKRKRDESPMGPPEKVPHKQDFLPKPSLGSLKSTESPPLTPTPSSPSSMRKFSPSPTLNRPSSLSGKLSPNMIKSGLKSSSSHHSPKNSPAHIPSSPKQALSELSSPKHHGTSPKHPSASSGKPSMSTLKNAANSPSSKSSSESKSKSSLKESSRDKDRKTSSSLSVTSTKNKSSSNKVKSLDLSGGEITSDGLPSPSGTSDVKTNSSQLRTNRKGSLSAIVDKLKVNAQHCDTPSSASKDRTSSSVNKLNESSKTAGKLGDAKNSEYMVKPSSDGMKITINKTRSKDNSLSSKPSSTSSSSSLLSKVSGTSSPKTHTGLKPGVNSGPASKKPQQIQKSTNSVIPNSTTTSSSSSSTKSFAPSNKSASSSYSKVSSSSNSSSSTNLSKLSSKLTGSPKMNSSSADLNRSKDKTKSSKSNPEKSLLSALKESRKASPTQSREEVDNVYKMTQSSLMEGRIKTLDKSFQIPKLSARISDDKKIIRNDSLNVNRNKVESKLFDFMKNDSNKYPVGNQMFDGSMEVKIRNNLNNIPMGVAANEDDSGKKDVPQNLSSIQGKDDPNKMDSISSSKLYNSSMIEALSYSTKSVDFSSSKFIAPAPKDDRKDSRKNDEVLDFSSKPQALSQSPSVSVHIVKSPAPSPIINPSPHSASPGITDDELMDEALVGRRSECIKHGVWVSKIISTSPVYPLNPPSPLHSLLQNRFHITSLGEKHRIVKRYEKLSQIKIFF